MITAGCQRVAKPPPVMAKAVTTRFHSSQRTTIDTVSEIIRKAAEFSSAQTRAEALYDRFGALS